MEQASTVDAREAEHFGRLAADWWNPNGSSAPLHQLNPPRLAYLRRQIDAHWRGDPGSFTPLAGKRALPGAGPWRVHYHVPLHADPTPPLVTTHEQLTGTLRALFGGERALTDHVEAETYTWSVLPAGQRPEDEDQLARGLDPHPLLRRVDLILVEDETDVAALVEGGKREHQYEHDDKDRQDKLRRPHEPVVAAARFRPMPLAGKVAPSGFGQGPVP